MPSHTDARASGSVRQIYACAVRSKCRDACSPARRDSRGTRCAPACASGPAHSASVHSLRLAFDVKQENARLQRQPHLLTCFSHTGEHDFSRRVLVDPQHPLQFTAGNNVETRNPSRPAGAGSTGWNSPSRSSRWCAARAGTRAEKSACDREWWMQNRRTRACQNARPACGRAISSQQRTAPALRRSKPCRTSR